MRASNDVEPRASVTGGRARPGPDERPRLRRNRGIVAAVVVALVVIGVVVQRGLDAPGGGARPPGPPAVAVAVAEAEEETWAARTGAVGTLRAPQGVEVTSELGGKVASIEFRSGERVERGELLVVLETSAEQAGLRAIEARLERARSERARGEELVAEGVISEEEFEERAAEAESLLAEAEAQRATIERKRVTAPFAGTLGIRQVDLGEYLEPGAPIVTLQELDPLLVDFELPEQEIAHVETGLETTVSVRAYPDRVFTGEVTAVSPLVDAATRTFAVQATIPNERRLLRPGMFADVTVVLPESRTVVAVPETAITYSAYGESVFLVREADAARAAEGEAAAAPADGDGASPPREGAELVVSRAFVRLGERRALAIEVLEGVRPGDLVVTAGQLRLDDGVPVRIADADVADAPETPREP